MILTIRVSNWGLRRVVQAGAQTVPTVRVSTPSSVTLSEAMCAAIHFSLPLPAVHLLFLAVGHLLPLIHLCKAAALPCPPSWTDGKQSNWSCDQRGGFPPFTSAELLATFLFNQQWLSVKWNGLCWWYQINRLGWWLTSPLSYSLFAPQCHRNMKLQWDNNSL